ncbi:signal transduction histidine-protein kinase/phosphatase UhpB [Photobacterium phosphoreum]|uniref:Signal transduction histidine-protein kinase/phosphatase UhpB n=1 Tax=Photobacterium phosphoreum TaxID=659 RepID=A0AAW4ZLZ6_PHOPO|nr:signal transduction histidine-protein kinase/phosphatase UhpB [Photobacterium phosphoreum]MCD9489681.1 signal transduction histidine-protein kinase/phosphatase UhpB [Photobacterium phosphoreum]MCF2188609.1 signal transduction histidine-protein kinase/phosphatase UhpB [Photobacterium phosphoreum]MCF2300252.1 signal transduction histidine-protein kinase/phosphatase UhpB [Photobacterium phosphoreum]OBU30069.1 two-component system sensor histidine kinase UhpB [Photobacterium phosphoreum]PSU7664
MRHYLLTSLGGGLFFICSWFCLWVIAFYFLGDPALAILFFPFALRLGITLHTANRYWVIIYVAEWSLILLLAKVLHDLPWWPILIASALSWPLLWYIRRYYYGDQWRQLLVMAVSIISTAIINVVIVVGFGSIAQIPVSPVGMIFLISVTGGLMLVPTCYLLWSFLFNRSWIPLTVALISRPLELRHRDLCLYALLFIANILLQINLPDELSRFAPFCLAIPIIVFAYRHGWQGALLGTLLNSVALIAARSGVSNMEITDLLLSLSAQSLTGILLGLGIQRQRDLNRKLFSELGRNQALSRQLIQTEESVRRDVARELHDEIGQNITAIRMQASILKRVETTPVTQQCASTIEQLSLNVYDTAKGLLSRLRPKTLDDLGLAKAVEQVVCDLKLEDKGIDVAMAWGHKQQVLCDTTSVTLYRICQEALNNIAKYSQATEVIIELDIDQEIKLQIEDNGIGFKAEDAFKGFGLRGIRERVEVLGGHCSIVSYHHDDKFQNKALRKQETGTTLVIILPIA